MNASLATKIIQKKIDEKLKNRFKNTFKFYINGINKFIQILREGIYPQKYNNEWGKFN